MLGRRQPVHAVSYDRQCHVDRIPNLGVHGGAVASPKAARAATRAFAFRETFCCPAFTFSPSARYPPICHFSPRNSRRESFITGGR